MLPLTRKPSTFTGVQYGPLKSTAMRQSNGTMLLFFLSSHNCSRRRECEGLITSQHHPCREDITYLSNPGIAGTTLLWDAGGRLCSLSRPSRRDLRIPKLVYPRANVCLAARCPCRVSLCRFARFVVKLLGCELPSDRGIFVNLETKARFVSALPCVVYIVTTINLFGVDMSR